MANDTVITVIGNAVADPELRFTPSGAAVANWTVASTPRTFDKNSNEWKDGETLFLRCSAWREMAENVAESVQKGMRIMVQGRLKSRSYETNEGEKRTVTELDVDEVGPSLKYASAKVNRNARNNQDSGGFGGGGQQGGGFGGGGQGGGGFGGGQQQGGGFSGGGQQGSGGFGGGQQGGGGQQQGGGFGGGQQQRGGQQQGGQQQAGGGNFDWGSAQDQDPPF